MAQNGTAWRQMAQMTLKHFPWVYNMIICHVGPPWALFRGPRGRIMAENSTKNGPLWPKMALFDQKWPFMTQKVPVSMESWLWHIWVRIACMKFTLHLIWNQIQLQIPPRCQRLTESHLCEGRLQVASCTGVKHNTWQFKLGLLGSHLSLIWVWLVHV